MSKRKKKQSRKTTSKKQKSENHVSVRQKKDYDFIEELKSFQTPHLLEKRILKILPYIVFVFFLVFIIYGFYSDSINEANNTQIPQIDNDNLYNKISSILVIIGVVVYWTSSRQRTLSLFN